MDRNASAVWPGRPYPLGATWDGEGVNFALFSEHADAVQLCLFDARGRHEVERIVLRAQTDQVWHGYLPRAGPGLVYGYRVFGRYDPQQGRPGPAGAQGEGQISWRHMFRPRANDRFSLGRLFRLENGAETMDYSAPLADLPGPVP